MAPTTDRGPRAFRAGVRAAALPADPGPLPPVTDADLTELPAAARRYLGYMGVVGRPRDWSFRAHLAGRFRLGADRPWLPCRAWQYNTRLQIARLFRMRIRFGPVPMTGWDTYLRGRGRMHGKLLGLVTVADGSGPEFDVGELVTYLNDAVLLAPSMLLVPEITWNAVDADAFDVSLTDSGMTVTARVFLDADGAPRDFSTEDRYMDRPGGPVQARWSTPVDGWCAVDGRPRPTFGRAVWHLPEGPLPYGEFDLAAGTVVYNVAPGD